MWSYVNLATRYSRGWPEDGPRMARGWPEDGMRARIVGRNRDPRHSVVALSHRSEAWLLGPAANVKEQSLADDGLHVVGVEGLGDEKRRLRARSRQQPLRIGRHENHRHREGAQDFVDGV